MQWFLYISSRGRPILDVDEPYKARDPAIFDSGDVSPQKFLEQLWPIGHPFVIRGSKIQGSWGPDYWISRYRDQQVTLENCETGETKPSTVAEFLCSYGTEMSRAEIWKLKVFQVTVFLVQLTKLSLQDWPPRENFEKSFPELFMALQESVPVPALMRLNGSLNMAGHHPTNGMGPDMGECI